MIIFCKEFTQTVTMSTLRRGQAEMSELLEEDHHSVVSLTQLQFDPFCLLTQSDDLSHL